MAVACRPPPCAAGVILDGLFQLLQSARSVRSLAGRETRLCSLHFRKLKANEIMLLKIVHKKIFI